jgi:cytidine deaminase
MNTQQTELFELAKQSSRYAYSPYSGYSVGAALQTKCGKIFTGCNIENASYGATNCAERTAIFKAVSEGYREFIAIAIYVDADNVFSPCGICRQVMSEFSPNISVIYGNDNTVHVSNLSELLPNSFILL